MNEPYKLPEGWRWVRLGEVCEFEYGVGLPERERLGGNISVYGSNGIVGYHSTSITQGPAIIIGRKGSIGQVNFSPTSCWPIDTTYYIDSTKTNCDLIWLYWLLKWLRLDLLNRATGVPGLNRKEAYNQVIPLAPVDEQRRIAVKLNEIMSEIEKARIACEKQLEAAKALPSAYLRKVFESEEAKKWEKRKLGDVVLFIKNGIVAEQNFDGVGVPVTRIETISNGVIDPERVGWVNLPLDICADYKLEKGDILFSHINSVEKLGNCAIYEDIPPNLYHGMNLLRIKANENIINPYFLLFCLRSDTSRNYYVVNARRAIGQASLNQKDVRQIPIPLPPLSEQHRIVNYLKEKMAEAEKLRKTIEKQLEALNALPQAYLRKAFRGEL